MCEVVHYWGYSAQPGISYYLQKLSRIIFGIINQGSGSSAICLFNECVGPKNTDHTISYLTNYINKLPSWIWRVHLFLHNTSSTNNVFPAELGL